ncbi:MAG: hypothetical protein LBV27_03945, partial [Oscillospiraceae bacterium]|nr:hypothetical protein [Oscillospiraceae bacterium]
RFMEGREEGADHKSIETARRMLADSMKPEQISRYTGLPVERIKLLRPLTAPDNAVQIPRL